MSRACASLRATSFDAFTGGISRILLETSTGKGSWSAKCIHGSPSGKGIRSGKRAKDRCATYESPCGCTMRRNDLPLWICPSTSDSISPCPQRRFGLALAGGSPSEAVAACLNSQATSPDVAWRA
ncbi:hypothetical protein GCM10020219_045470 [Nonomuraea dietziae]